MTENPCAPIGDWYERHRERTERARQIVEMYDTLSPIWRGRMTFRINGFIYPRRLDEWSWEERDPGLYTTILTAAQMKQLIDEFWEKQYGES